MVGFGNLGIEENRELSNYGIGELRKYCEQTKVINYSIKLFTDQK